MSGQTEKLFRCFDNNPNAFVLHSHLQENSAPDVWTRFSNADACKLLNCSVTTARIALTVLDKSGLIDREGCKVVYRPLPDEIGNDALGQWKAAIFKVAGHALADPLTTQGLLQSECCILDWIRAEFDLHLDVIPIVRARTHNGAIGKIKTWVYFTAPIHEAYMQRRVRAEIGGAGRKMRPP